MGYFLTASCFALLRAFSQNRFVKGKRSLNNVPCITAAGALTPCQTCAPAATCHPPMGRALTGTFLPQKLSGPLLFLLIAFLCSKTLSPPPSSTARGFSARSMRRRHPGEVRWPVVALCAPSAGDTVWMCPCEEWGQAEVAPRAVVS